MISDNQLSNTVTALGVISALLIILYHFLSRNQVPEEPEK